MNRAVIGALESDQEVMMEPLQYDTLSRRDIRSLIFHLLYAMEAYQYDVSLESLVDMINRGFALDIPFHSHAAQVAHNVITQRNELDELIKPYLINWRFERIGVCTRLILRLALWELEHTDTAPGIIINEAIELAKSFAEKDAYKFVNGVLDEFVKARSKTANS